jgi:hypothetical protein
MNMNRLISDRVFIQGYGPSQRSFGAASFGSVTRTDDATRIELASNTLSSFEASGELKEKVLYAFLRIVTDKGMCHMLR